MTQDALSAGNDLLMRIQAGQALLHRHLAAVAKHMAELSPTEQAAIQTALHTIHDPKVAALQTALTNLAGTYTASTPTT